MCKTSTLKLLKSLLCLLIFFVANNLYGQVNLKVGYNISYTNLEQTKTIFERFNFMNLQAEQKLLPNKLYHGIELGIRYRFDHFGIDLGLTSVSGSTEALNVFQADGSLGNDQWKTSIVNYSVGLESYFGVFGFGANIGTQKLKYKTDFTYSDGKKTVFDESVLSSRFYFILEVPSKSVGFSLRPYISTTWEPYNIQQIELLFDPQSTLPKSDFDQGLVVYGISFLFYNGAQRRH